MNTLEAKDFKAGTGELIAQMKAKSPVEKLVSRRS